MKNRRHMFGRNFDAFRCHDQASFVWQGWEENLRNQLLLQTFGVVCTMKPGNKIVNVPISARRLSPATFQVVSLTICTRFWKNVLGFTLKVAVCGVSGCKSQGSPIKPRKMEKKYEKIIFCHLGATKSLETAETMQSQREKEEVLFSQSQNSRRQ